MNWRTMTNDEVHDYAIQLWGEARTQCKKCGGDPDALNKLFILTEHLIQEKHDETKKRKTGSKKSGTKKRNLIVGMAIHELKECDFDWKKMTQMVWKKLPKEKSTEKTMRVTLKKNRRFIEHAAKGSKPGK